MLTDIEDKVQTRVERHLALSPRFATLHAVLFTLSGALFGLINLMYFSGSGFPSLLYILMVLWSIPLAMHSLFAFWQSGAWRGRRSRLVHQEVLDAGETYDLSTDEMIDLHLRVDEAIRKQSEPFARVLTNGLGNLLLWPGSIAGMLFVGFMGIGQWFDQLGPLLNIQNMIMLLLMGTLGLALVLPLGQLRYLLPGGAPIRDQYRRNANLRSMYAEKRKRHLHEAEARLASAYEQDEDELDEMVEIKRKVR